MKATCEDEATGEIGAKIHAHLQFRTRSLLVLDLPFLLS